MTWLYAVAIIIPAMSILRYLVSLLRAGNPGDHKREYILLAMAIFLLIALSMVLLRSYNSVNF